LAGSTSINTTFAKIGLKVGAETLKQYAVKFGFEEEINFSIPLSKSSIGNIQNEVDMAWTSLGQGKVAATPLQIARVMIIVNSKIIL
jgi:peptidoglycan glycosyltransferase